MRPAAQAGCFVEETRKRSSFVFPVIEQGNVDDERQVAEFSGGDCTEKFMVLG